MISQLAAAIRHIDPEITDRDIADALWLALQIRKAVGTPQLDHDETLSAASNKMLSKNKISSPSEPSTSKLPANTPIPKATKSGVYSSSSQGGSAGEPLSVLPFRSPAATALPGSLNIARVLRPFGRRVRQQGTLVLNEEATAKRIAEEDIWVPVLEQALTRWLEVALVVDIGRSMSIWRQTIIELHRLFARHGAFRDVRLWELDTNDASKVRLYAGAGQGVQHRQPRSELELIDTSSRRLVLVVTDCVSAAWHSSVVTDILAKWGHYNPVTLLQVLPRRLWSRTALGAGTPVRLHAAIPGTPNMQLHVRSTQYWDDEETLPTLPIPVVTLEPQPLAAWTRALTRAEDVWIPGFELVIHSQTADKQEQNDYALYEEALLVKLSAAERVHRFRANASPSAWRLAGLLAILPITLPIVRLVQQAMFQMPQQAHVAEVFLSGLLEIASANSDTVDPDEVQYDFVNGVREILLNSVLPKDSNRVLTEISALITSKFANPLDFGALLANLVGKEGIVIDKENRPFALMGAKALRRFGGEYVALADWLEEESRNSEKKDDKTEIDANAYVLERSDEQEQLQGKDTVFSEEVVISNKGVDDSTERDAREKHPLQFDVCIVCALAEEAMALLDIVTAQYHGTFISRISPRYGYDYQTTTIQNNKGEPLALHVSWLPRFGAQETILHLSHVLEEYPPRFVAMTGICAGDQQHVKLGDLVVAERLYAYDSSKFVTDEQKHTVHDHDALTYQLDENILRFLPLFQQWKPMVEQLRRPPSKRQQREWLLNRLLHEQTPSVQQIPQKELERHTPDWRHIIHELQQGSDPLLTSALALRESSRIGQLRYGLDPFPYTDPPEARCHIKPMASGSAVRSDTPFKDIQIPVRGTVAVEMEGAAFGRVMASVPGLRWLVVKGVSDYADSDKDDSYHQYASTASALYLLCFLREYVTNERLPRPDGPSSANQTGRDDSPTSKAQQPIQVQKKPAHLDPFPPVWNVPYRYAAYFTGRDHVLEQLFQGFTSMHNSSMIAVQALTGLGGLGKTQTAVAYAYRYRTHYQTVLWIRAETEEDLLAHFKSTAELLDRPEAHLKQPESLLASMQEWFRNTTNWLLILDNADNLAMVEPFLPRFASGHLLLTSREIALGSLAQPLALTPLTPDDGALCILRRANYIPWSGQLSDASSASVKAARELSQLMDGLPLALEQAGAYIETTGRGVSGYLDLYRSYRPEFQRHLHGVVPNYREPVAFTWKIAREAVKLENAAAIELLRLCAFLAPDDIPYELFIKNASILGPILRPVATHEISLDRAITVLRKYSLIKNEVDRDTDISRLIIHPVLQETLKDDMDRRTQRLWAERAVRVVANTLSGANWPIMQSNVQRCLPLINYWKMNSREADIIRQYLATDRL